MIDYKGFYFIQTYGLDDYFSKMYDDLMRQFDEKAQEKNYFEDQGFALFLGQEGEEVYENVDYKEYYFLDVLLAFPPQSLCEECTICWKNNDQGIPEFYWTTNFPEKELQEYIQRYG